MIPLLTALALLFVFVLFKLVDWTAYLLWLEALGFEAVFWRLQGTKLGLFAAAFAVSFVYIWVNLRILVRALGPHAVPAATGRAVTRGPAPEDASEGQPAAPTGSLPGGLLALVSLVPALVFGLAYYGSWDELFRFVWAQDMGNSDPVFGHDMGFYLFALPFLNLVQDSLSVLAFLTAVVLGVAYFYGGAAAQPAGQWVHGLGAHGLRHVGVNALLLLAAWAWGFYLERYDLLISETGTVFGAGYTDVHVTLPTLWVAIGATVALIAALGWAIVAVRPRWAAAGALGYAAVLFAALVVVPGLNQSFVVEPNELELETPYLRHEIALTRQAYALDAVAERSYDPSQDLDLAAIEANPETVGNIRLWDWRPLEMTFQQLQQIRAYYAFADVDIDRYRIDGRMRQTLLSARELSADLPGKGNTWLNRRLQYTHGYGLAMSLAAEKTEEGTPVLVVKDLPPQGRPGLAVSRPAVYYGETMNGYRVVNSGLPEFDYPRGDENVYASYAGSGGVALDAYWKKVLFATYALDINLLLTEYVTPVSRLQFWRTVQTRISRIAPFLRLDEDPYLILDHGRLFWVQDAYTTSRRFPYAEPFRGEFNYIRNSVKVVVDAYEGSVQFYVMDESDSVLRVYRAIFPDLFRPLEEMPEGMRRHLRYPQDLFEAQVDKYAVYHMTVPQVFYNREDVWSVPQEKYGGEQIEMQPYYVLMRLPGEEELQFLLMQPLAPANRDNMIAWMAARSDLPRYGEVVAFKLPKERLVLGPIQIEAMIDQDTLISRQLSLWDQRGSRVIRGNLLVIPLDHAFLYVEPVYLLAEGTNIPQLKRVIVSDGTKLAMGPTLQAALSVVFGERERQAPAPGEGPPLPAQREQARQALADAQDALRQGDWATFGRHMERLEQILSPRPATE